MSKNPEIVKITSEKDLKEAFGIRTSRRKLVTGAMGIIAGLSAGYLLKESLVFKVQSAEEAEDSHVLERYMKGFELVAGRNPRSQDLLEFVKKNDKDGTPANFLTTVIDGIPSPVVPPQLGHSEIAGNVYLSESAPLLELSKIPMQSVMEGFFMAHASSHIYDWVSQPLERAISGAGIESELAAYNLEFNLMDQYTSQDFIQKIDEVLSGMNIDKEHGFVEGIDKKRAMDISEVFRDNPLNIMEEKYRADRYLTALNFRLVGLRSGASDLEQENARMDYLYRRFHSDIPFNTYNPLSTPVG